MRANAFSIGPLSFYQFFYRRLTDYSRYFLLPVTPPPIDFIFSIYNFFFLFHLFFPLSYQLAPTLFTLASPYPYMYFKTIFTLHSTLLERYPKTHLVAVFKSNLFYRSNSIWDIEDFRIWFCIFPLSPFYAVSGLYFYILYYWPYALSFPKVPFHS